jgi:ethanolamine utilization protein EutA (predicted chaperonin)
VSVGIDIGSSTSHLMFSQLAIGYPSAHRRRPEILERKVIARSPVLLTPFKENWNIEAGPLERLIDESFRNAGLSRENIDTGAVIITGEAARERAENRRTFLGASREVRLRDRRPQARSFARGARLRRDLPQPGRGHDIAEHRRRRRNH